MELGDHVQMLYIRYGILRRKLPDDFGEYKPYYGVDTQHRFVIYYNTENRKDQPELEAKFAYSAWLLRLPAANYFQMKAS